jgi:xanthine/CO dehydrogenase XdhC/CoxF family maturation factor
MTSEAEPTAEFVEDPACALAHGADVPPTGNRRLVVVFASRVAAELAHLAIHVGFDVVVLEPDPDRGFEAVRGVVRAAGVAEAQLDGNTDVVVTDHDRPELGDVLARVLQQPTRWVGVMGSPRHAAPHVPALREREVPDADIARVHRPIGLDIGSRTPAEIAVASLAGLLADRAGRSGGFYDRAGR